MRNVTLLLVAAAAGAALGWRAARSGAAGLLLPPRAPGSSALRLIDAPGSREAPVVAEKLVALLELGWERGLELLPSVLGGR